MKKLKTLEKVTLRYYPRGHCGSICKEIIMADLLRETPKQLVVHVHPWRNLTNPNGADIKINKESGREIGTDAYRGSYYKLDDKT